MKPTRHKVLRSNVELKFEEVTVLAQRVSLEKGVAQLLMLLVSGNLPETLVRLEEEYWWRCSAEERRAYVKSWLLLDKYAADLAHFVPPCFSSSGQFPREWIQTSCRLGLSG